MVAHFCVSPAKGWPPVQNVPHLSPNIGWDPASLQRGLNNGRMGDKNADGQVRLTLKSPSIKVTPYTKLQHMKY